VLEVGGVVDVVEVVDHPEHALDRVVLGDITMVLHLAPCPIRPSPMHCSRQRSGWPQRLGTPDEARASASSSSSAGRPPTRRWDPS
jgi:hypothetical protein